MVIPARERRRAKIREGDHVEVRTETEGFLTIRKVPSLKYVQQKMAGRLPQWSKYEGKADKILVQEVRRKAVKDLLDLAKSAPKVPKDTSTRMIRQVREER